MDAQRYAEVKRVFREAIRWAPEEREAVIGALAEDEAVRAEVRSLLAHHEEEAADGARVAGAAEGGPTLAARLREERGGGAAAGWTPERVMRTLEPIARALEELGERGGVHGAVRADRVTLSEAGAVLVGVPAVEGGGDAADSMRTGAPSKIDRAAAATAAPEQLLPSLGPTGPWTDVYALALLCVELMLGRPATEGAAAAALTRARDEAAQPTPRAVGLAVPATVEAVLARALAMRPMERYQDVRRFWAALRASLPPDRSGQAAPDVSSTSSLSPVPKLPRAAERRLRRRARAILAAVLAAVAAIVIAVWRCG